MIHIQGGRGSGKTHAMIKIAAASKNGTIIVASQAEKKYVKMLVECLRSNNTIGAEASVRVLCIDEDQRGFELGDVYVDNVEHVLSAAINANRFKLAGFSSDSLVKVQPGPEEKP